jgi:predicted metal-binding protein
MADFIRCPGLEASVNVFPEIFKCPVCKGDIEIWSDEKKGRCPVCNKLIDKDVSKISVGHTGRNYHVEVKECKDESGRTLFFEQYETIIPVSSFEYAEKNKMLCEACKKYGKNFACPPYSPGFKEYISTQKNAKVLSIRMPQEYFNQVIQENIYWECFKKAESILIEELLRYRGKGYLIAGAGFCSSCEICAVEQGYTKCTNPADRIYSLEALGVNITALIKKCFNFDLEWSAKEQVTNFVCSTGAVFCNKKKICAN